LQPANEAQQHNPFFAVSGMSVSLKPVAVCFLLYPSSHACEKEKKENTDRHTHMHTYVPSHLFPHVDVAPSAAQASKELILQHGRSDTTFFPSYSVGWAQDRSDRDATDTVVAGPSLLSFAQLTSLSLRGKAISNIAAIDV
jgi:hypothetical protein